MAKKTVGDKELLKAVKRFGGYRKVAAELGIAYQTVKNRMSAINKLMGEAEIDKKTSKALASAIRADNSKVQRYIITSAQNATPINQRFWGAIKQFANYYDAQIIVMPFRYRNPTSIWTQNNITDDWWASELRPFLMDERVSLDCGLILMADMKIQPTATQPLSGLDTISGNKSAIFPHPKVQLKTVPTPSQSLIPKILATTGAVTELNYTDSKSGKKGEHFHCMSATVVEVSEKGVFHIRQAHADKDGSFIDLDKLFTPKAVFDAKPALGLATGDTHAIFVDEEVVRATYLEENSIVNRLKPKYLVWHDLLDFYARNHHNRNDPFINFAVHHSKMGNVEEEVKKTLALVDRCSPVFCTNVVVRSNHDEALDRWIKESDWRDDPENAKFYLKTALAIIENMDYTHGRPASVDPFEFWAREYLSCYGRTEFLKRDQAKMIGGNEVSNHGDHGPNGARGSIKAFTKVGYPMVIGHGHSPGIEEDIYQNGVSCNLNMGYNRGPSSWLHTHTVIYANGKRSLIHVIKGEYCA